MGASQADILTALDAADIPARARNMRLRQIWSWLYAHGVSDFDAMANVSTPLRDALAAHFRLAPLDIASTQTSEDGTIKWLFRLDDQRTVETVFIPEKNRGTLCISSQVGCTLSCRFCHTGTQKLVRNLSVSEIVGQYVSVRHILNDWARFTGTARRITNIVCMGMGEPLYNADNMADALNVISDGDGLAVSRRRITLSTAGVVPEMRRMGERTGVMLAVSLHGVRDDVRDLLVPLNKKYPLKTLLAACQEWPGLSNAKRITFEYVMLDGINDSDSEARELVRLLRGIPAKINLIPFNPWEGSPYHCASSNRIRAFADIVNRAGYASPVRKPRGRDIMAACGQLRTADEKIPASALKRASIVRVSAPN